MTQLRTRPFPTGTRVYIIGNHPWADCAGTVLNHEYNAELNRYGARVHLDDERIDVMVWHRCQLRRIPNREVVDDRYL